VSVTWGTGAGVDHQLGGGKTARGVGAGVGLCVGRGAGELLNVFSPLMAVEYGLLLVQLLRRMQMLPMPFPGGAKL